MSKENNKGNFEYALDRLLQDLVKGELTSASMLSRFDYARGNDWHITKSESDTLTSEDLEGNVVSHEAYYCAHCGHLEPINPEDQIFVYDHREDCRCHLDFIAHDMFLALANAMTHMDLNEVLLSRAESNIIKSMIPFRDKYLKANSHVYRWLNRDMSLKNKLFHERGRIC